VVKATIPPKLGVSHAPAEPVQETGFAATYDPNVTDPMLAATVDVEETSAYPIRACPLSNSKSQCRKYCWWGVNFYAAIHRHFGD